MKIGVVGYGVVGKAVTEGFRQRGHTVHVNDLKKPSACKTILYDKQYLVNNCDLIFICVPTPSKHNGSIDLSHVKKVVKDLNHYCAKSVNKPTIVIKSTVVPGTTLKLQNMYSLSIAVNPEFMRMRTALQDFLYPSRIIIGASIGCAENRLREAYQGWNSPIIVTDPTTAETIKYMSNNFAAVKVAFACEAANICRRLHVNAEKVMDAVCLDPRFNSSHLNPAMGPIPKDSACLPKDLSALIKHMEKKHYSANLLKAAYKVGVK